MFNDVCPSRCPMFNLYKKCGKAPDYKFGDDTSPRARCELDNQELINCRGTQTFFYRTIECMDNLDRGELR